MVMRDQNNIYYIHAIHRSVIPVFNLVRKIVQIREV